MIEYILPMGLLDIDDVNDNGETCLHWAAKNSKNEIVVMLLGAGIIIDPNIDSYKPFFDDLNQGRDCRTLVLDEVKRRSSVRYLNYEDVHICGGKLHMAIGWSVEMPKKLIGSGYDLEKRNCYGATTLHLAAFLLMNDVVDYLVRMGANVHSKDNKGYGVLHYCALAYDTCKYLNRDIEKCIQIFLDCGVYLNQVSN
jgi:ankyrin repeat protein